jgi:glutamine amidotransferase PdxT
MKIGVLALPGAFIEHIKMLLGFGVEAVDDWQAGDDVWVDGAAAGVCGRESGLGNVRGDDLYG